MVEEVDLNVYLKEVYYNYILILSEYGTDDDKFDYDKFTLASRATQETPQTALRQW